MAKHRDHGPPEYTPGTDAERVLLARYAMAMMEWRWFPGSEVVRSRNEQDLIPPLLMGLYVAKKRGKRISKAEACDRMGVDHATTGPKFIKALIDDDLVSVEAYPEIDKRKDFLVATLKLERLVEGELLRLARPLKQFADELEFLDRWSSIEDDGRVPSGGPSSGNLLPVDWPPHEVGIAVETKSVRSKKGRVASG